MPSPRLVPLPGVPALKVEAPRVADRFVAVADLHLGLGAVDGWVQGPPEASPMALADGLLNAARAGGVPRLVVAGDVKHPIVGVPGPLRKVIFDFFSELLSEGLRVEVVLGNHDVGLVPHLPKEVEVHPSGGVLIGDVGVFHGHRWPEAPLRSAPYLIAGHLHPGFRFASSPDDPESKRRCWVRSTFAPLLRTPKRRGAQRRFDARELVVLPAFHPLAGTESLNRNRPSRGRSFLFGRFLAWGQNRLYLLDGTDLGELRVPPPRKARRAPAAAPARR